MHLQLAKLNWYVDWVEGLENGSYLVECVVDNVLGWEEGGEVFADCLSPFEVEVYCSRYTQFSSMRRGDSTFSE